MAGETPFDPNNAGLTIEQEGRGDESGREAESTDALYKEFLQGKSDLTPMELISIFHAVPDRVLSEEMTEYYWRKIIDLDLPIREIAQELYDRMSAGANSPETPTQDLLRSYIDEEVDELASLVDIIQDAERSGIITTEDGGRLVDKLYATYAAASSLADDLRNDIRRYSK